MALELLALGALQERLLAQQLRRHAELADVVERRRLHDELARDVARAGRLREHARVMREAHGAVAARPADVKLERAAEAPDQLLARLLEPHRALARELLEVRFDAREHGRGRERLPQAVDRAIAEALRDVACLRRVAEEDHRQLGERRRRLHRLADLVAARAAEVGIEEHQVRRARGAAPCARRARPSLRAACRAPPRPGGARPPHRRPRESWTLARSRREL